MGREIQCTKANMAWTTKNGDSLRALHVVWRVKSVICFFVFFFFLLHLISVLQSTRISIAQTLLCFALLGFVNCNVFIENSSSHQQRQSASMVVVAAATRFDTYHCHCGSENVATRMLFARQSFFRNRPDIYIKCWEIKLNWFDKN